jgi:hypothetical protein
MLAQEIGRDRGVAAEPKRATTAKTALRLPSNIGDLIGVTIIPPIFARIIEKSRSQLFGISNLNRSDWAVLTKKQAFSSGEMVVASACNPARLITTLHYFKNPYSHTFIRVILGCRFGGRLLWSRTF